MDNRLHLVIMAGGIGSRFWPMSTPERPKQFIDVLGCGRTLLQLTVDRFGDICPASNIWVVTSAAYADIVYEQLPNVPHSHILLEPCRRNTAPCIAYVSWRIKAEDPRANIVVTPSDHIVMNVQEFRRVVASALRFTAETDSIVTLGMKPTRPETGYGYIQADLSTPSARNREVYRVDSFREKPDLATAERYIRRAQRLLEDDRLNDYQIEVLETTLEKLNAAMEQVIICRMVTEPATMKEFRMWRGILVLVKTAM